MTPPLECIAMAWRKSLSASRKLFWKWAPTVDSAVLFVAVLLTVVLSFVMLALLSVELTSQANLETPRLSAWGARTFLGILGVDIDTLDEGDYLSFVSLATSAVTAIVAVLLLILPLYSFYKQRRRLARASPVDVFPIKKKGEDDLWEMSKYFRNASKAIIFSGDFSWVLVDEGLRELLMNLADKGDLRLVSYRMEKDISVGWKSMAEQQAGTSWDAVLKRLRASFRFHEKEFKFSLICTGSDHWSFMAQVHDFPVEYKVSNVGVRSAKGEHARALVDIVRRFCDWERIDGFRRWEEERPLSGDNE